MAVKEKRLFRLRADKAFDRVGACVEEQALEQVLSKRRGIWISSDAKYLTQQLVHIPPKNTWNRLLLLTRDVSEATLELLSVYFRSIVSTVKGIKLLENEELVEVLDTDHPEDYLIGGLADFEVDSLILYRGNLEPLVIPFAWFHTTPQGLEPDFHQFKVSDFGQTVSLGDYEAATDAILYEFAQDTRRRLKARTLELEDSLGAAIRRLRLQKGLSLKDFAPLSEKTIGRIERGEVESPNCKTIETIASHLGVSPNTLNSY
ncbi:MAG: helix-turn-helix transcriptional regulator [Cyanobacteria bacterium P01_D01_bin.123]